MITAANGKQSIDTVTVTVGGKKPTLLAAGQTIQSAIDAAKPGDMIIVPTGNYNELLLMWKPVRLQGVGAASTSSTPILTLRAGKLDPWRRQVVCLFGLALNGTPISNSNPYDPSSTFNCTNDHCGSRVDRLPLEATVGWDATLNGNLAEQLLEPTLHGCVRRSRHHGAGKRCRVPERNEPVCFRCVPGWHSASEQQHEHHGMVAGRIPLPRHNPFPSNFWCNPSSIDGLSVTNSSQGGGGIMVHGWGHNIQIANNRVYNNHGTLSGGITVGQGEHPDAYLAGGIANTVPGSCQNSNVHESRSAVLLRHECERPPQLRLPRILRWVMSCSRPLRRERVASRSATAADYYQFNNNWVCGNMSTGDGGGVAHLGFSYNGDIEHNTILFNQSTNPTITTNGGGLLVMGAPDQDPPCATTTTRIALPAEYASRRATVPVRVLVINANLILGNAADSGSGGGLRLQHVNGTDVINFPNGVERNGTAVALQFKRPERLPLEHRQRHQQHHHQQRGWLGWRWRIAAGCAGGEHHQQHDHFQRLHGVRGRALRFAVRTVG